MTKRWVQKREDKRPDPDFDGASADFEPYDVTCARCGKVLSCLDAFIEESDEWECQPCWERCEAQERLAHQTAGEQK